MSCNFTVSSQPISFVCSLVPGLLTWYLTINFYYNIICKKKNVSVTQQPQNKPSKESNDAKSIRITCGIGLTLYSVGYFIMFLAFITCDANNSLFGFGGTLCAIGSLMVLVVFSERLYFTFNNTLFAVSAKLRFCMLFSILAIFISMVSIGVIYVLGGGNSDTMVPSGLMMLYLISNAIFLLVLFIKKLNTIIRSFIHSFGIITSTQLDTLNKAISDPDGNYIKDIKTSFDTIPSNESIDNNDVSNMGSDIAGGVNDAELSKKIKDMRSMTILISDMSKYTLLICFALISTFILSIVIIVVGSGNVSDGHDSWVLAILTFDNCVNSICYIMQFEYYTDVYYKVCGKCHGKCEDRYTKTLNEETKKSGIDLEIERMDNGTFAVKSASTSQVGNGSNNNNAYGNGKSGGVAVDVPSKVNGENKAIVQNTISLIAQKSEDLQMN